MNRRTPVKRAYDASGRRHAAAKRQTRILTEARRLFVDRGYGATTIEAIAAAAGVSVETIYFGFKSKAGLLARVVDVALAGDELPVPLAERPMFAEVRIESDQNRQIELLARNVRTVLERAGPLQWALLTASASEPEIAELVDRYQQRRLEVQTEFVRWLAVNGPLRNGMSVEDGGRIYWTVASTEVHHMLRVQAGFSADEYERWLARSLRDLLLT
jgi:AcrR family transcriptional regulator